MLRGAALRAGVPPDTAAQPPPPLVLLCFFVVTAGYWEDLPGHHEVRHRRGAHLFPQRGHPQLHDPQDGPVGQLRSEPRAWSCTGGSEAPLASRALGAEHAPHGSVGALM